MAAIPLQGMHEGCQCLQLARVWHIGSAIPLYVPENACTAKQEALMVSRD